MLPTSRSAVSYLSISCCSSVLSGLQRVVSSLLKVVKIRIKGLEMRTRSVKIIFKVVSIVGLKLDNILMVDEFYNYNYSPSLSKLNIEIF